MYCIPNERRNTAAAELVKNKMIQFETFKGKQFTLTCLSSLALEVEAAPVNYTVRLWVDGCGDCTCTDFREHGGACKHLRAALSYIHKWRQNSTLQLTIPKVFIPSSHEAALVLWKTHSARDQLQTESDVFLAEAAASVNDMLGVDDAVFKLHEPEEVLLDNSDAIEDNGNDSDNGG